MAPPLRTEVFGVSAAPQFSYVDRGQLDDDLADLLKAERHIVIHGGSKQGKTWLRKKVLREDDAITVQCQPSANPASIFQEALGIAGIRATLRYTRENTLRGEIDLSASGQIGFKVIAKAKAQGRLMAGAQTAGMTETAPIGRTSGDLAWVAFALRETPAALSIRRLSLPHPDRAAAVQFHT
jgi:hypothetical protein